MALPELQTCGSYGRLGAGHVHPSCGGPKAFERLFDDERADFQQYDPEGQAITTRWGEHEPTLPIPRPPTFQRGKLGICSSSRPVRRTRLERRILFIKE